MSDDMTIGKRIAECRLALMQISAEEWSLQQATQANLDAANIEQIGQRHAVLELIRGAWQQRLFIQNQDARSRPDGKDSIACLKPDDFPMSRKMPFGTQLVANLMGRETEFQTAEEAGIALSGFVYGKCWLMALALHRETGLPIGVYMAPHPCGSESGRLTLLHAFIMDSGGEHFTDVFGKRKLEDLLVDFNLHGEPYESLCPTPVTEAELLLLGAGPRGLSASHQQVLRLAHDLVPFVLELVAVQKSRENESLDASPAPAISSFATNSYRQSP